MDSDLKPFVYSLACAIGGTEVYVTLLGMYDDPSTMSEEKVRLLQALGSTEDETLMDKNLRMLLDAASGVRPQDVMYLCGGRQHELGLREEVCVGVGEGGLGGALPRIWNRGLFHTAVASFHWHQV